MLHVVEAFNIKKMSTRRGFVFCIEIAAIVWSTELTNDKYMLIFTIIHNALLFNIIRLGEEFLPLNAECGSSSDHYIRTLQCTETVRNVGLDINTCTVHCLLFINQPTKAQL